MVNQRETETRRRKMSDFYLMFVFGFLGLYNLDIVTACGYSTHYLICHRAELTFRNTINNVDYKKIIQKHRDAFIAGSGYPDSFYDSQCFNDKYHQVSEDTHWGPFLNATINYIRRRPQPWDESTEKLVSFMFGFLSHQTADILWHSLGIEQGFISTMAKVNFHDVYQKAHGTADFGGDVVNVYMKDMSFVDLYNGQLQWYVPVDDLYNIYIEYYGAIKIQKNVIKECSALLLLELFEASRNNLILKMAAMHLENLVVPILQKLQVYIDIAKSSPFLINQLDNYFLGGMDDMARWTQISWNDAIIMLQNGTSACSIPHNTIYINCSKPSADKDTILLQKQPLKNRRYTRMRHLAFSIQDLNIYKAYRGAIIQPRDTITKKIYAKFHKKFEKKNNFRKYFKTQRKDLQHNNEFSIYYSNSSYSGLGWSMVVDDIDGDGNDEVIVGAPTYSVEGSPQQGKVYILSGSIYNTSNNMRNIDQLDNVASISGPRWSQSKFGSSVAVLDINLDGIKDLAVGAPAYDEDYPKNKPYHYNGAVFIYLGRNKGSIKTFFNTVPNITIHCESLYCNLGHTMTASDVNFDGKPDLVLGSPYYQQPTEHCGVVKALFSDSSYKGTSSVKFEQLKWQLSAKQAYSWFGYGVRSKDDVLMISQNYRLCSMANCTISPKDIQSVGRLSLYNMGNKINMPNSTLTGRDEFQWNGFSSDLGHPYGNHWDILAVGSPGISVNGTTENIPIQFLQAGVVVLYNITNNGQSFVEISRFEGDRSFDRFGEFVKFEDVNGDGIDDLMIGAALRSDDPTGLVPRQAENGKLFIFYGGNTFSNSTRTDCHNSPYKVTPCPDITANLTLGFPGSSSVVSHTVFGNNAAVVRTKTQNYLAVTVPSTNLPSGVKKRENTGALYIQKIGKRRSKKFTSFRQL